VAADVAADYDVKLRGNVKKLGATLGNIIKKKDPNLFESVEKLRLLGREWRSPTGNHVSPCGKVTLFSNDIKFIQVTLQL
jgi:hypothetical protein